jgi:hypothetical protein
LEWMLKIVKEFCVVANVEHHHHHERGLMSAKYLRDDWSLRTQAETKPQMMVTQGSTTEQPEVMAVKPPSNPLRTSKTLQWPSRSRQLNNVVITLRNLKELSSLHASKRDLDPRTQRMSIATCISPAHLLHKNL